MTRKRASRPGPGERRPSLVWTERALRDLEAIGDYIAADDPAAAARWVGKLLKVAERAGKAPLAGRRVPEIGRDDIRELFLRTYRVVYRVRERRVEVLTIFEGHRLMPRDLADEGG
ncbi:MAG: type II toxin-antitoxin system RelE/ParE family toxin [Sandaracinaceae bacterium]|nr:type II toxin-antitoxin system RelE/ParE family toxin [Sandaracinaceae bacterium]